MRLHKLREKDREEMEHIFDVKMTHETIGVSEKELLIVKAALIMNVRQHSKPKTRPSKIIQKIKKCASGMELDNLVSHYITFFNFCLQTKKRRI